MNDQTDGNGEVDDTDSYIDKVEEIKSISRSRNQRNTHSCLTAHGITYSVDFPKTDCFLLFPSDLSAWFPQSPLALCYAC